MICPHCKKENLNEYATVCAYCNQNLIKTEEFIEKSLELAERQKTNKKKNIIIIVVAILLVVAIIIGAVIIGSLSSNGNSTVNNPNTTVATTLDPATGGLVINLPSVPATINNYGYNNVLKTQISVEELSYETKIYNSGDATVTLKLKVKMLKNNENATSVSTSIGYKLKDSDGIIVDSGTIYISQMAVGESCLADKLFFDLDPNETYTLTFDNVLG